MSVTYLIMQYRVQYIIAPVDSMGTEQPRRLARLSMKKAKVEFTLNFLCDFICSFQWWASSCVDAAPNPFYLMPHFQSDMDIQHAPIEIRMPSFSSST